MHVHDTVNDRDHRAPGRGETDLAMVARYMRPGMILTLELHPDVLEEDIGPGVELLRGLGVTWTD